MMHTSQVATSDAGRHPRTFGVDEARTQLGHLADEVSKDDEAIALTRRGKVVAVLLGAAEYGRLVDLRQQVARRRLEDRLADVRRSVAAAGIDPSVVDEAIAAARSAV